MIDDFKGKTAVLTGAGSGFGLECARIGARLGMNLVLVDVQQDALDKAEAEMTAQGMQVLARKVDVSNAQAMEQLAAATMLASEFDCRMFPIASSAGSMPLSPRAAAARTHQPRRPSRPPWTRRRPSRIGPPARERSTRPTTRSDPGTSSRRR